MNKISDTVLQDILQRCDIIEVISSYIPLKKAGRNFKALCPFHHEKTPSFTVSPDKQIFHCFGCGSGGDVFSFIMKHERMEFPEAIRLLAQRAGVSIDYQEENSSGKISITTSLYAINELAAGYFQQNLIKSSQAQGARKYLGSRGITGAAIEKFQLGYSFDAWDGLSKFLQLKGISELLLLKSGLVIKNAQGRVYDRFRKRVMFPIYNSQGKIIGFGGRILEETQTVSEEADEKQPKYINSPETDIYIKSKNLYGLNFSKKFIEEKNYCIVVEGYIDFIIPFQFGVRNLVASLGTAFTTEHVRILKRYTPNVVILFDADNAGVQAALRSLDLLQEEGMNVKVASLEPGFDPDMYVRRYGEEKFYKIVEDAQSLFDYKLNWLFLKFRKDVPEEKAQIAAEMLVTVEKTKNTILRETYIKKLAEHLAVSEKVLLEELRKVKNFTYNAPVETPVLDTQVNTVTKIAERMLLSLLFDDVKLVRELKKVMDYNEFSDPLAQKIAKHIFSVEENGVTPLILLKRLNDPQVNIFVSGLLAADLDIKDREKSFRDCVKKIKKDGIQVRLGLLQKQINCAVAADEEKINKLMYEYHCLKKEQKKL